MTLSIEEMRRLLGLFAEGRSDAQLGVFRDCLSTIAVAIARPYLAEPSVHQTGLVAVGRWPLDVAFPAMLRDIDLMRVTGYRTTQFYALKKRGVFRFLEARLSLAAAVTLYSGALVTQWSRGQLGSSRYFQSAARAKPETPRPDVKRGPGRPRKSQL